MSKRVSNKKGMPSRNKMYAHIRWSMQKKLNEANQLNEAIKEEYLANEKKKRADRQVSKSSFIHKAKEFFRRKV